MSIKLIVLDSSSLFSLFFPEDYSDWVENKVREYNDLHTLQLSLLETCNAAWKRIIIFKQSKRKVLENLSLLHKFIREACTIHSDVKYLGEAIEFSLKTEITIYDAIFLVLAEKLKTKLLTVDRKLTEKLVRNGYGHLIISPWHE